MSNAIAEFAFGEDTKTAREPDATAQAAAHEAGRNALAYAIRESRGGDFRLEADDRRPSY